MKPCVTEFLKMKDEIFETLKSNTKTYVSDNKENVDSCNSDETKETRDQSSFTSARSSATDTADYVSY